MLCAYGHWFLSWPGAPGQLCAKDCWQTKVARDCAADCALVPAPRGASPSPWAIAYLIKAPRTPTISSAVEPRRPALSSERIALRRSSVVVPCWPLITWSAPRHIIRRPQVHKERRATAIGGRLTYPHTRKLRSRTEWAGAGSNAAKELTATAMSSEIAAAFFDLDGTLLSGDLMSRLFARVGASTTPDDIVRPEPDGPSTHPGATASGWRRLAEQVQRGVALRGPAARIPSTRWPKNSYPSCSQRAFTLVRYTFSPATGAPVILWSWSRRTRMSSPGSRRTGSGWTTSSPLGSR